MPKKSVTLEDINRKLDALLSRERHVEREETEELAELEQLRKVEKEISKELGPHPLTTITYRDMVRGGIGALIGVVAHFTFFYGIEVATWLSMTRATLLYPFTLLIGALFMYATGFRKIKDPKVLNFLPARLFVLFFVSVLVSALVLAFFSPEFRHGFEIAYKQLATVTLIAMLGACTADLLGKD